jgi:hypothetical protein
VALIATYRGHVDGDITGHADSSPVPVNAGDILVAAVVADSHRDLTRAAVTMTWPDSRGFSTWVEHAFYGNVSDGAYVQVAQYRCPAAGSPGIHVVTSGSAQGYKRPSFDIWTISGADLVTAVAGSGDRDGFGNPMNLTLHSAAGTAGDTVAIIVGGDGFSVGSPYVSGSGIVPGDGFTQPPNALEAPISGFSTAASWTTPGTDQALTIDPPGGSMAVYPVAWMEFQAPRVAPVVSAGADASHTFGVAPFTRTASETGSASAREWRIQSGPAGAGTVIGTAAALSWSPTAAGAYVLRYSATNPFGTGTDDVAITVVGVAPTLDAGSDRTVERTQGLIRTAGEPSDGGSAITARQWRLMSGPGGSGAPVDLAAYGGNPKQVLLPSAVAGAHVIRYTATNATGPGYDEATITVLALRPTVNAGPDEARGAGPLTRTAQESAGDAAITSREWRIVDGPTSVGTVIGSAAALSWTPPTLGRWTLRYTATSSAGASVPDDCVISVGVTGVALRLGRSPEPKIAVSAAFGGNLADPDGSEWAFTEITTDVRAAQGIHLRCGRSDEAGTSQPAQLQLVLGNRHGRYSLGGLSPHWPNVRQGTPIRVECDLGAGFETVYDGYADGWTPHYSPRPTADGEGDATVSLSASGVLRRMSQGQPPVISPMRRGLVNASGVTAYWPCEDEAGATLIASAFPGHPPMDFSGRIHGGGNPGLPAATPRLAASDVFACSRPLPLISDSEWYGTVPDYTPGSPAIIQTRVLLDVPAAGSNDGAVLIGMISTGDPLFWELRYRTGGMINVRAWRYFSALVLDSSPLSLARNRDDTGYVGIDGRRGQLGLTLTQNGSAVDWTVDWLEVGAANAYIVSSSIASATVGKAVRVQTATDGGHMDMTLGHIQVRKVARNTTENIRHLNAWTREIVGERLVRLRDENAMWYVQYDPPPPHYAIVSDTMGPQPVGTVLDLFRDCETTDGGILWDGRGPGLSYTTKRYREAGEDGRGTPKLVLDAATGHVALPFEPAHDDAYRVNRAVARRRGGASAVFEDAAGPLGSGVVGRYEDSREFGVLGDAALPQYAGWMVGQGTAEGVRYPRLSLDLKAHPELLDEWLSVIPGDRVDVLNLHAIHPSAPTEDIALVVEGYEQTIYPSRWTVTVNTSLAQRWAVASVAAETIGGAGEARAEYVARVDTDASVIAVLTSAGQTTLDVIVNSGPLWTTNAHASTGDYPLYLDIGGTRVRATGATAGGVAGNPNRQTFTIDPMPVTRPAGTAVRLWQPPVYGL